MAYLMIFWMILLFDLFVSYTFTVVLQLQCGRTARGIRSSGTWCTNVSHVAYGNQNDGMTYSIIS